MSRRVPTPEQLDSLRETFRKQPPSTPRDFKAAGVRAGVTEAAARRAYTRGWPGIESIQAQLDAERARQQQSAEYLKVENIHGTMKVVAVSLLSELRRGFAVVKALNDTLLDSLDDIALMPTDRAVKTQQRIFKTYKDGIAIAEKVIEQDRLLAGEATSIVGVKQLEPEQAIDLDKLKRAVEREERRRAQAAPQPADVQAKETPDVDTSVN